MTQKQFNDIYKDYYKNYKVMTLTDRRLRYNDLIEDFRINGDITLKQAQSWGHPAFLKTNKELIDCNAY